MSQLSSNGVLAEIERLYLSYGEQSYGEVCTQFQHASQSGALAFENGCDDEVAIAAFLHDIGHLIAEDSGLFEGIQYGYAAHDLVGADYLQRFGFSEKVVYLVREHVQVKRYLVVTKPGYMDSLSHASQETLKMQGGPMSDEEVALYQQHPHLDDIVALRNIDDSGKRPEKPCEPLGFWLEKIRAHLSGF
ncbi:HDIG domain-containing protein [Marinomonas sp. C2222]|uniref:HDIG domain-containing protein n=1 Tax=Marinomonas sargassi TaxID=2984494 RepID=A0ABT2YTA9_9GAMM|nr:HDIG domain-containing metalloprotein [Marinomonas sargassi]MCV2403125.1 HDIG domain-containing protein [Marinomonas sargassi]